MLVVNAGFTRSGLSFQDTKRLSPFSYMQLTLNFKRGISCAQDQQQDQRPQGRTAQWTDLGNNSLVCYAPRFLGADHAQYYEDVEREVHWLKREVTVMGRKVFQPRLVAYYATGPELHYTYSGLTLEPTAFSGALADLKHKVEEYTGHAFNSCLLNYYRNGDDYMSWHSDNETLYGPNPVIASLSLGHARDFVLKSVHSPTQKHVYSLGCGDLLVMKGETQTHWLHSIPKRKRVVAGRINLTFRTIVNPERKKHKK